MISIMLLARAPTEYKLAFLGINRPRSAKWFDSSFILKHLGWIIEWKHTLWSSLEKSIQATLKDKEKSFCSFWWHILLNRIVPWRCKYLYKVNFDSNVIISTCIVTIFAHREPVHFLQWCRECLKHFWNSHRGIGSQTLNKFLQCRSVFLCFSENAKNPLEPKLDNKRSFQGQGILHLTYTQEAALWRN